MADRYWVGGTNNWNGTAGTKWATTSGGAGGASVPTTADDVFFTNLSTGTCTISTGNTGAKSINFTGFTGTFSGAVSMTVAGSVTLSSGMSFVHPATMTFTGTGTIITAGKNFSAVTVNGSGITITLGDAFVSSNTIRVTQGTFDAAGYNVTINSFSSSNSNVRTIKMGSGLWTLTGTGTVWDTGIITNLTFNKNTANILLSNTTATSRSFTSNPLSFNKLTIGGATGTSTLGLSGAFTLSELASTKTVAHTVTLNAGANGMTIDTWSITGTAGNVVTLQSSVAGIQRNFNVTNVTSGIDYLSVKDIAVNQANRFYVGANSTDGGNNNSNVIFTAAPSGDQTLSPSLYTNGNVFYSPAVADGASVLSPSLYTNTNVFYQPTVTAANTLAPEPYNNINIFYGPTATSLNIIAPPMFTNSGFIFLPTVAAAGTEQSLSPSLFTNESVIFAPTVGSDQPQPILGGGSLVRPRRKFRPAILVEFPEEEIVLPDVSAKTILAGLSATVSVGSVVARSPDPINSRASIDFTQIETYMRSVKAQSSWNDPSDEELLFILDFALD